MHAGPSLRTTLACRLGSFSCSTCTKKASTSQCSTNEGWSEEPSIGAAAVSLPAAKLNQVRLKALR